MNAPETDVFEAELTHDERAALLRDLGLTQVLQVRVKGGRTERAAAESLTLEAGRALLEEGAVRGLQVTYQHGGEEWCDTLLRTPRGTRLIRVRHRF